jgi:AcrR family transcriptional regulator
MLLRGELPEMATVAERSGVGRTSLYRWFGDRDALIGDVLARYLEAAIEEGYRHSRARGGRRVARAVETLLRDAAAREPFLRLLRTQPQVMLKIIMTPGGAVHARSIATTAELIERERRAGRYRPILDAGSLAFILVQIGQSFMWARAATGAPPDVEETMRVTNALLCAEAAV